MYLPQDAEDATQESFRTWLYRIVVNHVLTMKRGRADMAGWTFTRYGDSLDGTLDMDLPDPRSVPADVQLLVDEARIGCTSGMLLCLDREQRLIYILGEIFGVTDLVGGELSSREPGAISTIFCTTSAVWSTKRILAGARRRRRGS